MAAQRAKKTAFKRAGKSYLRALPSSFNYARAGQRAMMPPIQNRQHEIKFVDNAQTTTGMRLSAIPPTGVYLGGPVQGAAPYQRIGQRIANKSLRIRGVVTPATANATCGIVRIIVVYDEQANGAVPAYADVISAYTAAGANSSTAYDGVNMNNRERFKVLIDEQFQAPATTVTGDGVITAGVVLDTTGNRKMAPWNFDRFVPLKDLVTHFKASAGGIGDVATGSLIMFVVGDSVTDGSWQFIWSSRLRYDDL